MKNDKIHEFDPIIYPYKVWIIISEPLKIIGEHFNQFDNKEITSFENCENLDAFVMPVRNKINHMYGCVIYFSSRLSMTYNIVAHESSHAAKYLFEYIDADIKPHEPFEYVVGWIAECCDTAKKY